mmetsp:Transcript_140837/g.351093  ORF Transcript_140837/g.351093 Transcript_140837/m.351093 type:complete len:185 (-) Transcript_140837:1219-1773(-)
MMLSSTPGPGLGKVDGGKPFGTHGTTGGCGGKGTGKGAGMGAGAATILGLSAGMAGNRIGATDVAATGGRRRGVDATGARGAATITRGLGIVAAGGAAGAKAGRDVTGVVSPARTKVTGANGAPLGGPPPTVGAGNARSRPAAAAPADQAPLGGKPRPGRGREAGKSARGGQVVPATGAMGRTT